MVLFLHLLLDFFAVFGVVFFIALGYFYFKAKKQAEEEFILSLEAAENAENEILTLDSLVESAKKNEEYYVREVHHGFVVIDAWDHTLKTPPVYAPNQVVAEHYRDEMNRRRKLIAQELGSPSTLSE